MPEPAQPLDKGVGLFGDGYRGDRLEALMAAMQPARTTADNQNIGVDFCLNGFMVRAISPSSVISGAELLKCSGCLSAQNGYPHGQRGDHFYGAPAAFWAAFETDAIIGAFIGIAHCRGRPLT